MKVIAPLKIGGPGWEVVSDGYYSQLKLYVLSPGGTESIDIDLYQHNNDSLALSIMQGALNKMAIVTEVPDPQVSDSEVKVNPPDNPPEVEMYKKEEDWDPFFND